MKFPIMLRIQSQRELRLAILKTGSVVSAELICLRLTDFDRGSKFVRLGFERSLAGMFCCMLAAAALGPLRRSSAMVHVSIAKVRGRVISVANPKGFFLHRSGCHVGVTQSLAIATTKRSLVSCKSSPTPLLSLIKKIIVCSDRTRT